jgi:orotate phosphoribosyltransferase
MAILEQPIPGDKGGRTFAQAIAQAMVKEAVKGRVNAAAEIADRVEGKTLASMAISGPDGGAIPLATLTAADLTDDQLLALIAGK